MKAIAFENKISDTNHFINTQEFNRLTKISLDTRMKEAEKSIVSKTKIKNALDLGDKKNIKNKKLQTFQSSYFFGKNHVKDD